LAHLVELDQAITDMREARKRIEAAVTAIAEANTWPYGDAYLYQDDDSPERLWLNGFSCIRPSDEFARDVGRSVIQMAIRRPGKSTQIEVTAS
ncbi:hypothetical protein, partial [Streptomyces sp. P17]